MLSSTLSNKVLLALKVGDVVRVKRGNALQITAPIINIEHRWGTGALPLVTLKGHNSDWCAGGHKNYDYEGNRCVSALMILEVIKYSSHRESSTVKQNIFADNIVSILADTRTWCYPRHGAKKGQLRGKYGNMGYLFIFALAKLPYELKTVLHENRAVQLWEKAGCPGLVSRPAPYNESFGSIISGHHLHHLIVNEKQFCRFVRQNWSKLVMTKAEMNKASDDFDRWENEQSREDIAELF